MYVNAYFCQAIGDIFSAGVWIGLFIAVIVIIVLLAVFRKKADNYFYVLLRILRDE